MAKTHFTTVAATKSVQTQFYDTGKPTGNVFWVCSVTGTDSAGYGLSPDAPFATLNYATTQAVASNNDAIYLMSGHVETYTTTGTKWTSKAGITVIGLGAGVDRPTFTFSHAAATFTLSAASVTIKNILLVTGIDNVTTFATISGADNTLEDVETRDDTTPFETIDTFIATGARLTVRRHVHNGTVSNGVHNARVWKLNGVVNALFEDCRWYTKVTTAVVNFVTTLCTGVEIRRCLFQVSGTSSLLLDVVDTIGSSTWAVTSGSFDLGAGKGLAGGSGAALAATTISNQLTNFASNVTADVTAGGTSWTTGHSPVTIFTVTGTVMMRCFGVVQTGVTSTATTGTLELGVVGNTAVLIPQTTANGTNLATGHVWTATTTKTATAMVGTSGWCIVNANVVLTVATNSMTAGAVTIYAEWRPISSGATVA